MPLYSGPEAAQRWRNLLLPADDGPADAGLSGPPPPGDPVVILLPDPFCPGLDELLVGIDAAWPDAHVTGGLASGFPPRPGSTGSGWTTSCTPAASWASRLYGDIAADARVAQGCHPVGQPFSPKAPGWPG